MDLSLKTIFGMDGTGFRADLKQTMAETRAAVSNWANIVSGVAVAAVVALSKGAIDLAGKLSDTSQNLGINVISLQALEAQHKRNGVAQEGLTKGLEKTRAFQIDVINGDKKALETLAALNIQRARFMSLPLDQAYAAIAKSTASATDRAKAYNAASEIFGEKIGPKMQASLRELGEVGLPGVTKAAQEAGQVMSAETIAALDRAGDAIDDFKKRATVAVGSIIVNFRTEDGLKLLGMQFLRIVGTFGAKLLDALSEVNQYVGAVLTGAFVGVANKFRDSLLSAVVFAAEQINRILPKRFQVDVGQIEALKSAGLSVGATITEAIAKTKPSTFAKDVTEYWDKAITDQQKVVDQLNQVDLGKDAKKLTDAGKDFEKSGKTAAAAIVTAGKEAAEELKEAAAILGGIGRKGRDPEELSPAQLDALAQNIRDSLAKQRASDSSIAAIGIAPGAYRSPQQRLLEQELARVQAEQALRRNFAQTLATRGEAFAERNFAPSDFERLKSLAGLTTAAEQTNQKLDKLTDVIRDRLPVGGLDTLNRQLDKGVLAFVNAPES
jgi:hypothetical protein